MVTMAHEESFNNTEKWLSKGLALPSMSLEVKKVFFFFFLGDKV